MSSEEPSSIHHVALLRMRKALPHELLYGPCCGLESYCNASLDITESIRADKATTTAICIWPTAQTLDVRPEVLSISGYNCQH
jgi:hypothetical protein